LVWHLIDSMEENNALWDFKDASANVSRLGRHSIPVPRTFKSAPIPTEPQWFLLLWDISSGNQNAQIKATKKLVSVQCILKSNLKLITQQNSFRNAYFVFNMCFTLYWFLLSHCNYLTVTPSTSSSSSSWGVGASSNTDFKHTLCLTVVFSEDRTCWNKKDKIIIKWISTVYCSMTILCILCISAFISYCVVTNTYYTYICVIWTLFVAK